MTLKFVVFSQLNKLVIVHFCANELAEAPLNKGSKEII